MRVRSSILLAAFISVALVFVFLSGNLSKVKMPSISANFPKNGGGQSVSQDQASASTDVHTHAFNGTGPLDPYANKVFLMLKSGATVVQNRLPPHIRSTLKRWPNHQVYADVETRVGGQDVIDIIKWLPDNVQIQHRKALQDYFTLRRSLEEDWIWELDSLAQYKGWDLDRFKNVPMLAHAWLNAPDDIDWFFFMDMDTYMFQRGLLDYLKRHDPSKPYYLGRAADWETIGRDKNGVEHSIPFAHGGSGVALSRAAMAALFGPDPKNDRRRLDEIVAESMNHGEGNCCGDAVLSVMLFEKVNQLTVSLDWGRYPTYSIPFQGSNIKDIAVSQEGWCLPYYGWHHLTPRDVDILFEYEESLPKDHVNVTFANIYKDFILPYVVPERESWNAIWGHTHGYWEDKNSVRFYSNEGHEYYGSEDPTVSKEACILQCERDPQCLLWVFEEGYCQYEKSVVYRGVSVDSHKKDYSQDTNTGWMVDRIRKFRAESPCDSLKLLDDGTYNDNNQTSEGWFVRSLNEL